MEIRIKDKFIECKHKCKEGQIEKCHINHPNSEIWFVYEIQIGEYIFTAAASNKLKYKVAYEKVYENEDVQLSYYEENLASEVLNKNMKRIALAMVEFEPDIINEDWSIRFNYLRPICRVYMTGSVAKIDENIILKNIPFSFKSIIEYKGKIKVPTTKRRWKKEYGIDYIKLVGNDISLTFYEDEVVKDKQSSKNILVYTEKSVKRISREEIRQFV